MSWLKSVAMVAIPIAIAGVLISMAIDNLPIYSPEIAGELSEWRARGSFFSIFDRSLFVVHVPYRGPTLDKPAPIVILVHGFPSSSFDYRQVSGQLSSLYDVWTFDHIGFGFSEKPSFSEFPSPPPLSPGKFRPFSFSLNEHADNLLELIRQIIQIQKVNEVHLVSHDMGDSVVVEILTRMERQLLPPDLQNVFKSVLFTNGGMRFSLIAFRFSQRLLMTPGVAPIATYLGNFGTHFFEQQLRELWGNRNLTDPSLPEVQKREQEIQNLCNSFMYQGGHMNSHRINFYLKERSLFDERWVRSLSRLSIPCTILWADNDPVSPITIAQSIHEIIPNSRLVFFKGSLGHFTMLEDPDQWSSEVLKHLSQV